MMPGPKSVASPKTSTTSRKSKEDPVRAHKLATPGKVIREWLDVIIIALLLAMFIRMFVVELLKIPSSSMTPTLLGTEPPGSTVSFYDVDNDGKEDMILRSYDVHGVYCYNVYKYDGKRYHYAGAMDPGYKANIWMRKEQQRQDRIIVCKFFYWFSPPKRGDIVVFKVPSIIYTTEKPIYIKRVAGLPGETLSFVPAPGVPGHMNSMGHLVADGKIIEKPDFFKTQIYEYGSIPRQREDYEPDTAVTIDHGNSFELVSAKVPNNSIYVFGDNTVGSLDSRYWGPVPLNNLRGRAVFRYWKNPMFLK
jgi:signal peptidase I